MSLHTIKIPIEDTEETLVADYEKGEVSNFRMVSEDGIEAPMSGFMECMDFLFPKGLGMWKKKEPMKWEWISNISASIADEVKSIELNGGEGGNQPDGTLFSSAHGDETKGLKEYYQKNFGVFPREEYSPELAPVVEWSKTINWPGIGEDESFERLLSDFDARIKYLKSRQPKNAKDQTS